MKTCNDNGIYAHGPNRILSYHEFEGNNVGIQKKRKGGAIQMPHSSSAMLIHTANHGQTVTKHMQRLCCSLGPIKHFFSVLLSFLALYLELSHPSSCWVKHASPYSQACMYCGICWFNLSLLSSNTPHRKLCCFMFRPPKKIGGRRHQGASPFYENEIRG